MTDDSKAWVSQRRSHVDALMGLGVIVVAFAAFAAAAGWVLDAAIQIFRKVTG